MIATGADRTVWAPRSSRPSAAWRPTGRSSESCSTRMRGGCFGCEQVTRRPYCRVRVIEYAGPMKVVIPIGAGFSRLARSRSVKANFVQPIVRLAPYNANLEYRVAGVNAPASMHEREAEMFYVVEGSGTLVTGG